MVDCPRFAGPRVRRLEDLVGIATMVLTHRDDVADHRRFAAHFGCRRVMHADDQDGSTADVEMLVAGRDPVPLDDELVIIPVPGHTKGSICLLHADRHLFTGDYLAWDQRRHRLTAFRDVCWYAWDEQVVSMQRLAKFRFGWVLPGHGAVPPAGGRHGNWHAGVVDATGQATASIAIWLAVTICGRPAYF